MIIIFKEHFNSAWTERKKHSQRLLKFYLYIRSCGKKNNRVNSHHMCVLHQSITLLPPPDSAPTVPPLPTPTVLPIPTVPPSLPPLSPLPPYPFPTVLPHCLPVLTFRWGFKQFRMGPFLLTIEEGLIQKTRQTVVISDLGARSYAAMGIFVLNVHIVQYCVHTTQPLYFSLYFCGGGGGGGDALCVDLYFKFKDIFSYFIYYFIC